MNNAIALGTFDGVHIGHRAVLDLPNDCNKIAVVFKEPPKAAENGIKENIMTYDDKCRILKNIGIDEVFALDFSEIKNVTAEDFLNFLNCKFSPHIISCGFNYRFGKNAQGTTDFLKNFCSKNNITLKCCPPVKYNDLVVSSTAIRSFLKEGKIAEANELLTEDFSFTKEVICGDRRGRTIGFPTINQKYPENLVTLKFGVYKTKVCFDGCEYNGITNIGVRPTYHCDYVISETYIDNFSGDLYGKTVTIKPLRFLRSEVKFSSLEALKKQIVTDINS